MVEMSCDNYGFDCEFKVNGNDSKVIEEYQKHSIDILGIEYSTEVLTQYIFRIKNY